MPALTRCSSSSLHLTLTIFGSGLALVGFFFPMTNWMGDPVVSTNQFGMIAYLLKFMPFVPVDLILALGPLVPIIVAGLLFVTGIMAAFQREGALAGLLWLKRAAVVGLLLQGILSVGVWLLAQLFTTSLCFGVGPGSCPPMTYGLGLFLPVIGFVLIMIGVMGGSPRLIEEVQMRTETTDQLLSHGLQQPNTHPSSDLRTAESNEAENDEDELLEEYEQYR